MTVTSEYTTISDLKFGYADAGRYLNSPESDLFFRYFLAHPQIDKLLTSPCYYLVGEKGTGKTAFATYYSSRRSSSVLGLSLFVQKNDYLSFRRLLSKTESASADYTEVWKTIIIIIIFHFHIDIFRNNKAVVPDKALKLAEITDKLSLGSYDNTIAAAFDLFAWDIALILTELGASNTTTVPLRTALRFIQTRFAEAMKDMISGNRTVLVFIDGIDTRPFMDDNKNLRLDYSDYMNCVSGLVSAVWNVNTTALMPFFGHSVRAVLLIRPDIIDRVGLQNLNSIMTDNSFLLNWYTNTNSYRRSHLFQLSDNILLQQQSFKKPDDYRIGDTWDHYFPEQTLDRDDRPQGSFFAFLRNTFYRPRDIITLLEHVTKYEVAQGNNLATSMRTSATWSKDVRSKYSEYLLGEVKEALSFYHETEEYDLFLTFFRYLSNTNGGKHNFTYKQYELAYEQYKAYMEKNDMSPPPMFVTVDSFLQFLYELNVITFKSAGHESKIIWNSCVHERSYANIRPKVLTHSEYRLHYGLARALQPARIG